MGIRRAEELIDPVEHLSAAIVEGQLWLVKGKVLAGEVSSRIIDPTN